MFGLSLGHLLVLLVVVLLFGSRRLPELGSALGKGMHAFKKGLAGEEDLPVSPGHIADKGPREPDAVLPPGESQNKKS
jgi:sec-independent protein translocase protein TatA